MQNTKIVTRTTIRNTIVYALAVTLTLAPVGSVLAAPKGTQKHEKTQVTRSAYIGAEKAMSIALEHAGVSKKACCDLEAELDHDKDKPVHYDVEFKVGSIEYEYDINALTGEVMSREVEIDD